MQLRTQAAVVAGTAAERLGTRILALLAAVNLVFFALFLASVVFAARSLASEAPAAEFVCEGENLVERLSREQPEKLEAAIAEAATIVNGEGVQWRISKPGIPDSFLLGTMHSADPRIARLRPQSRAAFDTAKTVIVESTGALDPQEMAKAFIELREFTLLTDGSTLDAMLPEELLATLRESLEARAMPWGIAKHMQPALVAAAIAVPVCEFQAKQAGKAMLDAAIALEAREKGKELVGLETIAEQFGAMAAVPRDFHVTALAETLRLSGFAPSLMETTKQLYLDERIALLMPAIRIYAPQSYSGPGYETFQKELIVHRNERMASRALAHLEKGGVFMAVGALHLPGDKGVIELLRRQGFTLERVAAPENSG
jgi:uncharacterized protein YbaP (TraB family)